MIGSLSLVPAPLTPIGDEGEAELLSEPGDRLAIVAYDEGDVGEGLGNAGANVDCRKEFATFEHHCDLGRRCREIQCACVHLTATA